MTHDLVTRFLVLSAVWTVGAVLWFFLFWPFFSYWRKHPVQTYAMVLAILGASAVAVYQYREILLGSQFDFPVWAQALGWLLFAVTYLFYIVADRQIGFRVRTFVPFFETNGRIELKTTGVYGLVRHPIYASGLFFQLGLFFATGYKSVLIAAGVYLLQALWFTRQEEKRLVELLEDPTEYERYRARVPALIPTLWGNR